MVKSVITLETGSYIFNEISKRGYFVEALFLWFSKSSSDEFSYSGSGHSKISPIQLKEENTSPEKVTVSATRPLFEMEIGKLVVNMAERVTSPILSNFF
jgi:hypothetical protein